MTKSNETDAVPKVVLTMIVKNEAHVIERCIASVRPIIDAYLIVDTGSEDGTQDVIRVLRRTSRSLTPCLGRPNPNPTLTETLLSRIQYAIQRSYVIYFQSTCTFHEINILPLAMLVFIFPTYCRCCCFVISHIGSLFVQECTILETT